MKFTNITMTFWYLSSQADNSDFEDSSWFNTLVFMGYRDGETIDRSDDDLRILPSVVDKLIIPKLTCE